MNTHCLHAETLSGAIALGEAASRMRAFSEIGG